MSRDARGAGSPGQASGPPAPSVRVGLAFLLVVGSAWHFVYAASGGLALIGLVAPINESVWEHSKLIAIPLLIWAAIIGVRTRHLPSALVGGVAGGVVGTVLMVVGYYGYVAVLGHDSFPLDMVLFVLCALAALSVLERVRVRPASAALAVVLVATELAVFAALTAAPPDWPLFVPGAP